MMNIDEMNLQQIDKELFTNGIDIDAFTNEHNEIAREIEALRLRMQELENVKIEVNRKLMQAKSDRQRMAFRREQLMRDRLENEAISETVEKIVAILDKFPAWEAAHEYQKMDIAMYVHAYLTGYEGFLNANDMGLGKTMETFVALRVFDELYMAEHGRKPRVLWVTKSSILKTGGTIREMKKWYPDFKMMPIDGSRPAKEREGMFELVDMIKANVITNYESIRTTKKLNEIAWDIIVIDEVHKLKGGANPSGPTGIWKACLEITRKARMVIMLSGTPMVNKPTEMWAYLHIFDPERFPSSRQFENQYTATQKIGFEYKMAVDAEKLLNTALKGRMIRRRKDEVGLQMPDITPYADRSRMLEMNPEQRKIYNQMRDFFYIWLEKQDGNQVLTASVIIAQLIRLRQINVWPAGIKFHNKDEEGNIISTEVLDVQDSSKIDEVMEDIEAIGNEQFVLFCSFNEPLYEVQRRCKELDITCEVLAGETSKGMANMEVGFQNGDIRVLCINSAMGEGLNLQKNPEQWSGGASYVGFLDLWYNAARNDQCTDRVYRQGATEPVTVIHYKNESSVDQWMDALIEEKWQEITGVSEGKALRPGEWKQYLKDKI